jgi:hypothetical protein
VAPAGGRQNLGHGVRLTGVSGGSRPQFNAGVAERQARGPTNEPWGPGQKNGAALAARSALCPEVGSAGSGGPSVVSVPDEQVQGHGAVLQEGFRLGSNAAAPAEAQRGRSCPLGGR